MKTKHWIILFAIIAAVCIAASLPLFAGGEADYAEIYSEGKLVATVALDIDRVMEIGGNTVTVRGGKIGVTSADCPDHYCMDQGFCSGGRDIVCLPNRLVISFVGQQAVDAVVG